MARPLPDQSYLLERLDYNLETGVLTWRAKKAARFGWNKLYSGNPAFNTVNHHGYCVGKLDCVEYSAHRIIWKLVYGQDPEYIDHINGNPADNRLSNLRNVSIVNNNRNTALPSNNKSGVIGVSFFKKHGAWRADIYVAGKQKHLGRFSSFEDAVAARKAAEREYGYHPNHGRAA